MVLYQSNYFKDILPPENEYFEKVVRTDAMQDKDHSLALMRKKMIEENDISIAAEVVLALATSVEEHSNLFNRLKKVVDNIKDNKKTKETLIEIANGVFDRRS